MYDIDVHIIRPVTWNTICEQHWFDECMDSLTSEPVNVYITTPVVGDIRAARYTGYSMGQARYVSFVDPDDKIVPGTYEKLLHLVNAPGICGAYSNYQILTPNGEVTRHAMNNQWSIDRMINDPRLIHQVVLTPRKITMNVYEQFYTDIHPAGYELFCVAVLLAKYGNWANCNDVGYTWRIHDAGHHHTVSSTWAELLQLQNWARGEHGLPPLLYNSMCRFHYNAPFNA